ncbi:MAG: DUF4173 domain-containing protein [Oscillospiraceae bacterium]|nr:DUF4173 domain-containing protein [Oscillospiraceae bacterium]
MEMNEANNLQSIEQSQWHNQTPIHKEENKFKPGMTDFIFALVAFVLGYLFSRWVWFAWHGWGVTVFTTVYLLTTTLYLYKKAALKLSGATIFWLAVTWLTGASYALWDNAGIAGYRSLFLFCFAVYYILVASGCTILGRTSNYLLIDGLRSVIIIPFRNIFNQYVSFSALAKGSRRGKIMPVLLGVIVSLILASIIIPLLETADAGGFGMVLNFIRPTFNIRFEQVLWIIFAIPFAAYIYGLVSGTAHKKGTDAIKPESVERTVATLRFLQSTTVYIVLGVVCAVYLLFIFSQLPYFFSAFTGVRPEGWRIYSEFARHGFFELCWIAAINLSLLTASNLCSKKLRIQSRVLKIFNIALAVITLVLIATAFSKMALYIGAYGLTMRRLLPCVFMIFLAIVFAALIALQKWQFSIVRLSVSVGAIMLVIMCLSNPDAMVVRYNANRYLDGTLNRFDTTIAWRAGSAGVMAAIDVMNGSDDGVLRNELRHYIASHSRPWGENHTISLERFRARQAVIAGGFMPVAPTPQR